jgi:hypothetical protein
MGLTLCLGPCYVFNRRRFSGVLVSLGYGGVTQKVGQGYKLLSDCLLELYSIEKDVVYMVITVYCDR